MILHKNIAKIGLFLVRVLVICPVSEMSFKILDYHIISHNNGPCNCRIENCAQREQPKINWIALNGKTQL